MQCFRSPADVAQLPTNHPALPLIRELLSRAPRGFDPAEHGFVALVEPSDFFRLAILPELPCRLSEVPWEAVEHCGPFFLGTVITNNDFVISLLIPNERWIDPIVRRRLEEQLPA